MPISFFNKQDDQPKKQSFFQRIRQAVTGETESQPELPTAPPAPQEAVPTQETVAPQNAFELLEREGVGELPIAEPDSLTPAALEVEADATVAHELGPDAVTPRAAGGISFSGLVPERKRNEFGLRPTSANFSFGGYASEEEEDAGFVGRMRDAVGRTREQLGGVFATERTVDEETLDELETMMLRADIGSATTSEIMRTLRQRALRESVTTGELKSLLKSELRRILDGVPQPTNHPADGPEVLMMVGVNGTGKTTTSGKLAALYGTHGRKALLCAADTFRAAAIEQLEVWAQRSNVDIIKTKQGGDPSAALYDSLTAGRARGVDVVIVDTAGRLHNKAGLMAELDKMRRTAQKLVPGAPHQVFLVLDATTGQNGMQQARLFTESAGVTGIVLTKLDGTAKGGIVVAIARELRLPVVFAGVGEKMEDIVPFDSDAFLDSLLGA